MIAVSEAGATLRLLGSACAGCESGCGGRCNLLRDARADLVQMPLSASNHLAPGQTVVLMVSDRALRDAAYAGYGRVLIGLLAGTMLGGALASVLALPVDPLALAGLVLGVLYAARRSGSAGINPTLTLLPAHSNPSSHSPLESQESP